VDKICLTLPTNRACTATIAAIGAEAAYAAEHFDVEVHLLVLDSTDGHVFAEHAVAIDALRGTPNVVPWHLDEAAQRNFLRRMIEHAGLDKPELMLDLMLPAELSYGACTNRAFLLAAALGCRSVHRRDSDIRYQTHDGATLFPIHHELRAIGRRAADAVAFVSESMPVAGDQPIVLVGGSFVGELSVDIGDIARRDPDAYHDIVRLWAPSEWSDERKRALVAESFTGAGTRTFTQDHALLTVVDPMRVDMCNIAFHRVQEDVPLLPAIDTVGSDYFLFHVVESAGLPGVLHNRDIVNFYTPERRTDDGFVAYHVRLVKFFLSMRYLNVIYARMADAGPALLDERHRVRADVIAGFVRDSTDLDQGENVERLAVLDRAYRRLGDRYASFADVLRARAERLLDEARRDMADFALLIESWDRLMGASRVTGVR